MTKSFAEHLTAAIALPLEMSGFLSDFEKVALGVAQPGRFELHGLTIDSPPGVYSPHPTSSTRFVMDNFPTVGLDKPAGRLLEIGCGAGAIALLAARHGWQVCAGDIDANAVKATTENARANGLTVEARESDLFAAFEGQQFDAIVFNQPFFHVESEVDAVDRTLSDFGGQLYVRFMADARRHLAPGGFLAVTYSNCSNAAIFNQSGWSMVVRAFDFGATTNYIRALFRATPIL
jgi:methylase of polypeptide subunit release factors